MFVCVCVCECLARVCKMPELALGSLLRHLLLKFFQTLQVFLTVTKASANFSPAASIEIQDALGSIPTRLSLWHLVTTTTKRTTTTTTNNFTVHTPT